MPVGNTGSGHANPRPTRQAGSLRSSTTQALLAPTGFWLKNRSRSTVSRSANWAGPRPSTNSPRRMAPVSSIRRSTGISGTSPPLPPKDRATSRETTPYRSSSDSTSAIARSSAETGACESRSHEAEDSTEDNRPDAVRPPARGIPTMRRLLRRLRTRRAGALRGPATGSSDRRTGSKERPVAAPSHTSRQSFLASSLVSSPVALSPFSSAPLFRGI